MSIFHKSFSILVRSTHYSLRYASQDIPAPLRNKKKKAECLEWARPFIDFRPIRAIGGKGGDGCVYFLRLWSNPDAGPNGGNGGNGGHVLLEASHNVHDFSHVKTVLTGENGEKGYSKGCDGHSAPHTVVEVPVGTIIKSDKGVIIGDLSKEGAIFLAARGGAGGKGNSFFATDTYQAPPIAEYGGEGENKIYLLEIMSIAHIGLIGYPNAGKSTLLQAISRARPKVAPYPFTTLQPHIGIVPYDDYEQISVADLPGLIPDSHLNKGLGIGFLKHAERCRALLFLLDASCERSWEHYHTLRKELHHFNPLMCKRPSLVIANKIDLPSAQYNLQELKANISEPLIAISAKYGKNISELLHKIRKICDAATTNNNNNNNNNNNVE